MNISKLAIVSLVILSFGVLGVAQAQETAPHMHSETQVAPPKLISSEWGDALKPMQTMPVQDFGFIRSGYTFGENHLMSFANKRKWKGIDPLVMCVWLMADQNARNNLPLVKIYRPEFKDIYGSKIISHNQFESPQNRAKLSKLINTDQSEWTDPANKLYSKIIHIKELEEDFAIFPREGEWLSPPQVEAKIAKGDDDITDRDKEILKDWNALKAAMLANNISDGAANAESLVSNVKAAADAVGVDLGKMKIDVLYHSHAPFAKSAFLYLFALLFYGASIILKKPRLAWAGYAFLSLGFIEQLVGIVFRWVLAGRAPLSNMYESFTFAIAGMILVSLIFEAINRKRMVGLGSALLGFIFMVLAHKAPIFDSQIRPLMPALQSSWLTYHVVTIMLSYSAFSLSFFLSVLYIFKDFLGGEKYAFMRRIPSLESIDILNYKVIGVGFPLLTIGIILGAVWAATAWGRPWGFDPKETWSAITWLVYAIYLHVRYLAGWKGRRAAWMAILGFGCVLFTYFGVNYLLPGLHSYV